MKKAILGSCMTLLLFSMGASMGCGGKSQSKDEPEETEEVVTEYDTEELIPVDEDPAMEVIYADTRADQVLADFLIDFYQIPEEYQQSTRYYYNKIDLNEDGNEEIVAVVVGEYTELSGGDPAVILATLEGQFEVLDYFTEIRTPVYVCDQMTDGWHDLIFPVYGGGNGTGFMLCHYSPEYIYSADTNEFLPEMDVMLTGKQILSNNLIDDMDKGNYLTLKPMENPLSTE